MPPSVSIITVYYNTPDDLRALAASIRKHLPAQSYEWIIVDNNSQENLAEEFREFQYLRMQENGGFGKACNRGADSATAPALFFANPDCEFVEDCITPLLPQLKATAVIGPRVVYPDGHLQLSFGPFLSIANEARQKRRIEQESSPAVQMWIQSHGKFSPDYVSACAMLLRAEMFHAIGGFDETFFLYHEDVDLCKRIRERSGNILYDPSVKIVHRKNTSAKKEPERVSREYRRSQLHYYRKHNGALQNLLLNLYLAVTGKSI